MKKRKFNRNDNSFWVSTGDLMAGILFIFILLFVVQLLNVQTQLEKKRKNYKRISNSKK